LVAACKGARDCAGLEVHKKTVLRLPLSQKEEKLSRATRTFEPMIADLLALADWLMSFEVNHAAVESTEFHLCFFDREFKVSGLF